MRPSTHLFFYCLIASTSSVYFSSAHAMEDPDVDSDRRVVSVGTLSVPEGDQAILKDFHQRAMQAAPVLTNLPPGYSSETQAEGVKAITDPMSPFKHLKGILDNREHYPDAPIWQFAAHHYVEDLVRSVRLCGVDEWISESGFKNHFGDCPEALRLYHPMVGLIRAFSKDGNRRATCLWDQIEGGQSQDLVSEVLSIISSLEQAAQVWSELVCIYKGSPEVAPESVKAFLERFVRENPRLGLPAPALSSAVEVTDPVEQVLEGTGFFTLVMDAGLLYYTTTREIPDADDKLYACIVTLSTERKYGVVLDFSADEGRVMDKVKTLVEEYFPSK